MSIYLTFVDAESKPLEVPQELTLTLLGDGRPLAQGVPEGGGVVRFDASVQGLERLAVRAERSQPD